MVLGGASHAAIIAGGDAGHLTAPVADPGWNRVGRVGTNGSGIYLGNGWVLTANHVSDKTTFLVDGDTTYNVMAGSENTYRMRNTTDTADIDLYMFRVSVPGGSGLEGLGTMPIATSLPGNGTVGTHIGTGEGQTSASATTYYVDVDPATWVWDTEPFAEADATVGGYSWAGDASRDTRWNQQVMSNNDFDFSGMEGFRTNFEAVDEFGMVADNDSGSPMFFNNGGTWELSGIAISVTGYSGQPSRTSMYGNDSVYADISAYRDQIVVVVPEIASWSMLALTGAAALLLRRKRNR